MNIVDKRHSLKCEKNLKTRKNWSIKLVKKKKKNASKDEKKIFLAKVLDSFAQRNNILVSNVH